MDATTHDVTDSDGTRGLEAVFEVEVPPAPLLEVLWSPANFRPLFPDIKDARVVRDEGARIEVAYRIDAVIRTVSYVLARTLDRERGTIAWREIGGELRRVRGGWRIELADRPGTSRVTYSAFVDIGFLVPTGLVRNAARRKLGDMVARVQRVAVEIHATGAGTST